jgi:hypothetical protein
MTCPTLAIFLSHFSVNHSNPVAGRGPTSESPREFHVTLVTSPKVLQDISSAGINRKCDDLPT